MTKFIFSLAITEPTWLNYDMLELYQQKYPTLPPYLWDPSSREKRGKERADKIINLITFGNAKTVLDLGCGDGMVCYALQRLGKTTIAVDFMSNGFDKRAIQGGVQFHQMDASHLAFKDESFDVVISCDAFEHFRNPEAVQKEAIRVVKPGGYIFHQFAPLYMSTWGAHFNQQITVPYCHLLFTKDMLKRFADSKNLGYLNFDQLNGCTIEDFRAIFLNQSDGLRRIRYREGRNISHLELISKHPSCFKSKTNSFDDLITSNITVLFQKKG